MLKMLVVANSTVADIVRDTVGRREYVIEEAGDEARARSKLSAGIPDVMIVDMTESKIGGAILLSALQRSESWRGISVICLVRNLGGYFAWDAARVMMPIRAPQLAEALRGISAAA